MQLRNQRAITLIEVLTVIGITALLGAIAYPVLSSSRAKSRETSCVAQLRQIHGALEMYGADYIGFEPLHPNANYANEALRRPFLLVPYLGSGTTLFCPETPECAKAKLASSYVWTVLPPENSPLHQTAKRQLEEWFGEGDSGYPVVHCLVHDEIRYFPSEKHLSEALNPPFVIRLLTGGAVRSGRYQIVRGHDITRSCR